jgi:hypothetical protein
MRVSNRSIPIIDKLNKGTLGNMPIFEGDKSYFYFAGQFFTHEWKHYHKNFKKDINIVSSSFYQASKKAQEKLRELWSDIVVNDTSDFDIKGTYVVGDFVLMLDYEVQKGNDNHELAFFMFDKTGIPLAMYVDSEKRKIYQNGWLSSCFYEEVKGDNNEVQKWIYGKLHECVILEMFKSFAEVETKIIPAKTKIKDINCKYVNDTDLQVTYLDSKWFTNLINSNEFTVRGHFRLQPKKKDGEWTKELIWISEFKKNGYTFLAKIEK